MKRPGQTQEQVNRQVVDATLHKTDVIWMTTCQFGQLGLGITEDMPTKPNGTAKA